MENVKETEQRREKKIQNGFQRVSKSEVEIAKTDFSSKDFLSLQSSDLSGDISCGKFELATPFQQERISPINPQEHEKQDHLPCIDEERSFEKLRDEQFSPGDVMDVEMFSATNQLQPHYVPVNNGVNDHEERVTTPGTVPEKGEPLSVTENGPSMTREVTTPEDSTPGGTGTTMLDFHVVSSPHARVREQTSRKRKCLFDEVIIISNNAMRQQLKDTNHLVSKRRKAPCTPIQLLRFNRVSSLPDGLFQPLISCASLDLMSYKWAMKAHRTPEFLSVSEPPTSTEESAMGDVPLDKLAPAESPTIEATKDDEKPVKQNDVVDRSRERTVVAPKTPVQHTKPLRSIDSPDVQDICPLEYENEDRDLLFEDINTSNQGPSSSNGWLEQSRKVMRYLDRIFEDKRNKKMPEVISILDVLIGRTREESARFFYDILVLTSKGYIEVEQQQSYGDILVSQCEKWDEHYSKVLCMLNR